MADDKAVQELTLSEWQQIQNEIREQPPWRREADMIADYYDGNQLDSETLQAMEELGMAPIIENLMAPAIDSVLGLEAKNRVDCIVTPAGDGRYTEVADGVNQKLNEAERESGFDRACADAHAAQVKVGLGVVCIGLEHDPFKYPHKAEHVHRNECFWDWRAKDDLSDARYFVRQRWHDIDVLAVAFPEHAELIRYAGTGWAASSDLDFMSEGGHSTGLARGYAAEHDKAWTTLEHEWRETYRRRMCLSEVWYRRWVRGKILRAPDGRVVEYNPRNPQHRRAVESGMLQPQSAMFSKVYLSWWIGPHKLADMPNPYRHGRIPYVLFFGKREDLSRVPYGLGRPMKSLQDEVNARNTKMQWLLVAKRVTMTKGVADVNETRNEAARPDAVHVLDADKMRNGGIFKVDSDFALNQQQYQALVDKREALKNVAGVYKAFEGQNGNATSGRAIDSLVDQSTQTLAEITDNFRMARTAAAELLLANVIDEIGDQPIQVEKPASIGGESKVIALNQPTTDEFGNKCLTNDVQRARLKIALSDVPSTASYRKQRFMMLSELAKSLPPQLQAVMLPYVIDASDEPERDQIVQDIKKALGQQGAPKTPEEAAAMEEAANQQKQLAAIQAKMLELQVAELAAKIEKMQAETEKALREARKPAAIEAAEINAENRLELAAMNHGAATERDLQHAAMAQLTDERRQQQPQEKIDTQGAVA